MRRGSRADHPPLALIRGYHVRPAMPACHLFVPLALAAALAAQAAETESNAPPATSKAGRPVTPNPARRTPTALRPPASDWFPTTLKTIRGDEAGDQVKGDFAFRNPRDHAVQWRKVSASCACSHVEVRVGERRYRLRPKPLEIHELVATEDGKVDRRPVEEIPIAAGESGVLEIHADLRGKPGRKVLTVDVHSTDADEHQSRLRLDVQRDAAIVVSPASIQLGVMGRDERRDFSFLVRSPSRRDFRIDLVGPPPKGMTIEPERTQQDGRTVWRVRGTYGPIAKGAGQGGTLKFATDIPAMTGFSVRIDADVRDLVTVSPGFLSLGRISKKNGKRTEVVFRATDGTDLAVEALQVVGATAAAKQIQTNVKKTAQGVTVELIAPPGLPGGLLKGELQVSLNHPKITSKTVVFNGFVR